jgi:hypothetical protein
LAECIVLKKEMLKNPVEIHIDGSLDFDRARKVADREAKKISPDPLLLAWYNAQTGKYSPPVECCGEDKPTWLIYAESRGGTLCIDINDENYVFVYRPSP